MFRHKDRCSDQHTNVQTHRRTDKQMDTKNVCLYEPYLLLHFSMDFKTKHKFGILMLRGMVYDYLDVYPTRNKSRREVFVCSDTQTDGQTNRRTQTPWNYNIDKAFMNNNKNKHLPGLMSIIWKIYESSHTTQFSREHVWLRIKTWSLSLKYRICNMALQ